MRIYTIPVAYTTIVCYNTVRLYQVVASHTSTRTNRSESTDDRTFANLHIRADTSSPVNHCQKTSATTQDFLDALPTGIATHSTHKHIVSVRHVVTNGTQYGRKPFKTVERRHIVVHKPLHHKRLTVAHTFTRHVVHCTPHAASTYNHEPIHLSIYLLLQRNYNLFII